MVYCELNLCLESLENDINDWGHQDMPIALHKDDLSISSYDQMELVTRFLHLQLWMPSVYNCGTQRILWISTVIGWMLCQKHRDGSIMAGFWMKCNVALSALEIPRARPITIFSSSVGQRVSNINEKYFNSRYKASKTAQILKNNNVCITFSVPHRHS